MEPRKASGLTCRRLASTVCFRLNPCPTQVNVAAQYPGGNRFDSGIRYATFNPRHATWGDFEQPGRSPHIKRAQPRATPPAAAVDEQGDRLLMHCAASDLLRTGFAACARYSPWPRAASLVMLRGLRESAEAAVQRVRRARFLRSARRITGIQLRGQGCVGLRSPHRCPVRRQASSKGGRWRRGRNLTGSIAPVRIVPPREGEGRSALRVAAIGLRAGRRGVGGIVDAGRDTSVARDRRRRAMEAGGHMPPDEVGPAARGGRCRELGGACDLPRCPRRPAEDLPGREAGSLAGSRGVGFAVRPDRIARVTAPAPDASLFITNLACGQCGLARGLSADNRLAASPLPKNSSSYAYVGEPDSCVNFSFTNAPRDADGPHPKCLTPLYLRPGTHIAVGCRRRRAPIWILGSEK